MTRAFALSAIVLALLYALLTAQQSGPPADAQSARQTVPVFRTRVDLVVLDVSVLDRDRRPVRGLDARDFTVLEDGRPQTITMFSAVDIPEPEQAAAPWMRDVASDVRSNEDDADSQIVVLVLDDANPMAAGDMVLARQQARTIVDRLGPRDLAAVVFVAEARNGQEFTHDRARLLAAIDRFNSPPPPIAGTVGGALEMLGPTMALRTLKGQAESLVDLPAARKALIFISTRGAALPDALQGVGDAEGQEIPEGLDAAGMNAENFGEFGDYVRAAQRANVNVYCLDPGGLHAPQVLSTPFGKATTTMVPNPNVTGVASLQALSVNTGGFAIVHTNDPQPGLTQAFRENRSYYLLAYASSNPRAEGRYRRVQIRVNRPGTIVRTRSGYFEPQPARKGRTPPTALNAALSGVTGKPDVPMRVAVAPFALPGKREAAVAIVAGIRHDAPTGNARFASFDVSVNAYDYMAKGRAWERFNTRVAMRPGEAQEAEFELLSRLDVKPGRYQLRLAVAQTLEWNTQASINRGVTPTAGSVYCDLDVPDFANAPLSLSGLVLTVNPSVAYGPKQRFGSLIPVVPTTVRRFIAMDDVSAFLRVYEGRKVNIAPATVEARIVDSSNRVVARETQRLGASAFSRDHSAEFTWQLPLRQLAPGEHLLTIEAKTGKQAVRRDVRFSLR